MRIKQGPFASLSGDLKKNANIYLMLAPPFVLTVLFCYLPLYGLIIGFKDYDVIMGYADSPWVGLKQFRLFFSDPYCFRLIKNTFLLGVYNLAWGFSPPVILALLLNEARSARFRKIIQSISYLPHFVATVVIVGMMIQMFEVNGVVNDLLSALGLQRVNFFNEAGAFRSLYIGSGLWQGVGYSSIIHLATLSGVDQEMYESAYIDGANRFQRVMRISLPSIMPTITILLILSMSNIINIGFEKAYLMQNPATYETSDVINTYVYRRGMLDRNFSYSTAVGLLNSVVSFGLLYITNKTVQIMNGDSIW
jgi:putative aldouronate transport system permease protein